MSKSNKTTKIATFFGFTFCDPATGFPETADINNENTGECDGVLTSCGLVSGVNTFTSPMPGERVVLRRNVGRGSWGTSQWVMTGYA